jgi:hypothetical protein
MSICSRAALAAVALAFAVTPAAGQEAAKPGPLTFMLVKGIDTTIVNRLNGGKQNAECFSNVVTLPGPAGWNAPGAAWDVGPAQKLVAPYEATFLAKCGAIAPVTRGPAAVIWNHGASKEGEPEKEYAKRRAQGQPEVDID